MYYVYFIKSERNSKIYVGSTSKDPHVRTQEHNQSSNVWTKHNKPFVLIYYESYLHKEDASLRENFYKTGFGKEIKSMIVNYILINKIKA